MSAPFKIHQSPHSWAQNNPILRFGDMNLKKGALPTYALFKSRNSDDASRLYVVPNGDPIDGTQAALKVFFDDYDADYLAGGFNYRDFGVYADTARKGVAGGGTCFLNAKTNGAYFGFNPEIVFSRSDGNEICFRAVTVNTAITESAMASFVSSFRGYHKPGRLYSIGDTVCSATGVAYIAASAGIAGVTSPSHLAGTVSDGAVNWTFQFNHAAGGGAGFRMFAVIGRKDDPVYWNDSTVKECGLQLTRDAAVHNGRGLFFLNSTGVPVSSVASVGNSLYIGNSGKTKGLRVDYSGNGFLQHVGVAELLGNTSITSNTATPSVAECSHLTLGNTVATTVTQFLDGKAFQRIVVRSGTVHTTLQHGTYIRLRGNQSRKLTTDDAIEFVFNSAGTVATEIARESGPRRIYSNTGSVAAPLETISGVTSGIFTTRATIPANSINPHESVRIEAYIRKNNANGTWVFNARLGTTGTVADASAIGRALINANDQDCHVWGGAKFGNSPSSFIAYNHMTPNAQGTAVFSDAGSNVNTAFDMYATISLSSINALDTFDLISLAVYIE